MGYWKYEIVHDYNTTRLIKEFREENLTLKNSKGADDDELDFIMYAEKDDHTISLGKVLLIKMSDAMVRYYHEYKDPNYLPDYWAKYIYAENKSNKTFQFNEEEISDAFLESIKLQTKLINISAIDLQNHLKKITEKISSNFRNDEKFSHEEWDPTLKSDKYLFAKPEFAINYFIQKCDSLKTSLIKFRKQLELFKSFKIIGKEIKIQTIEEIIQAIDEKVKSIENLKKELIENRDDIQLKIPYICGAYNGLVEFIAGFIDIALLAVNIVVSDLLGGDTNLEFLEIREGVEEMLSKVLQDPGKVFKDLIKAIKNYKYSRYDDPKLNQYQIQYNEGEDTVLVIDIIFTIVTIVKGIAKLAKQLSNFVKWVDEILDLRKTRKTLRNLERLKNAWKSGWSKEKILAILKGEKPSPIQYLKTEYVIEHYNLFQKEGIASRIVLKDAFENYGIGKPDLGKTEFFSRKSDIDDILMLSREEQAKKLGIPVKQIEKGGLVRIDFDLSKKDVKIEMPSGNEWGANPQWIPGGVLPDGNLEAIIRTDGLVENVHYTIKYIK
ncbi:hypothetical protein [Chryseobacterium gwangjuense]|uniref:hypothetical protein n=1 Tax=Chryseobacterium gwangjuense TaxID=1069980 RepID=UPI001E5BA793|nr:hypothetical protein [Chryseobacterium gwangjuense]MCE3075143.1 hypothetical protein [Chryseobacterium gwangjuense]